MAIILPFPKPLNATSMPQANNGRTMDSDAVWRALMLRAQDGDKAAYSRLLEDIAPYLRAIARRYLGNAEDAEDAVQEILLVVHGIRHTYEANRPFKPWLSTIAMRRCIDLLRRRSRRIEHELLVDDAMAEVHDASPGPEQTTSQWQQAREVRDAVADLSPRQQEAIQLVHLQELSLNEASAQSKQTTGSLKVACHRAIKRLQRVMGQEGNGHD